MFKICQNSFLQMPGFYPYRGKKGNIFNSTFHIYDIITNIVSKLKNLCCRRSRFGNKTTDNSATVAPVCQFMIWKNALQIC